MSHVWFSLSGLLLLAAGGPARLTPRQANCGVASLVALAEMLGRPVSSEEADRLVDMFPEQSVSLEDLLRIGPALGLHLEGYRAQFQEVADLGRPAIMHLTRPEHFCVLVGASKESVQVIDAGSMRMASRSDVESRFTGHVLLAHASPVAGAHIEARDRDHFVAVSGPQQTQRHVFRWTNTGTTPLHVELDAKSCNCVGAKLDGETTAPGQSGGLTVEARNTGGEMISTVVLKTDDPDRPRVLYTLRSRVPWQVRVDPQTIAMRVRRGNTGERSIQVTGAAYLRITAASATRPFLTVGVDGHPPRCAGQATWIVWVKCAANAPVGAFEDEMTIRTTDPHRPTATVPVRVMVEGDLVVTPAEVFFGFLKPRARATRRLSVRSQSGAPFHIRRVRTTGGLIHAEIERPGLVAAAPVHFVRVSATTDQPGILEGTVELTTDVPGQEKIRVPVSGLVE